MTPVDTEHAQINSHIKRGDIMEIESKGFRITGICAAVPRIEVNEEGLVRLFATDEYLSPEDFTALRNAINAAHARIHGGQAGNRGGSRLTAEDVLVIRRRLAAGERANILAREFGVSQVTLSNIRNRKSWAHLPRSA